MRIGTRQAAAAILWISATSAAFGQSATEPYSGEIDTVKATSGQPAATRAERELFAAVNDARRSAGMTPLRWNDSLAAAARRHAAVMAEHRTAEHEFQGEPSLLLRVKETGAHFSWLSENVTQGPHPQFIHAQFMQSSHHRANILDTDMNSIGVGVVERAGQLFAVEDFAALH